jgi:hypothetical protein
MVLARKLRLTLATLAVSALAAVALAASVAAPAQAIPYYEKQCTQTAYSNTPASGWVAIPWAYVQVNNGTAGRWVKVQLSADSWVSLGAEIRVGWRVGTGAIQTVGPQNFKNYTQYWATANTMNVIWVPAGWQVIQPYWRISGGAGSSGVMGPRCTTAEGWTS